MSIYTIIAEFPHLVSNSSLGLQLINAMLIILSLPYFILFLSLFPSIQSDFPLRLICCGV